MAFKDLFIKEESAPPKQPIVVQEVAPNAESVMPVQPIATDGYLEEVCK